MRHLYSLTFLMALLAATACKSTKYTPENFPQKQLLFGTGGGFTGQTRTLVLLENGQVFLKEMGATAFSELPKVKKKEAKSFYEAADDLQLGTLNFNHPGNLYQFVELQKDGGAVRATWGDDKFPVDQKVKDLFIALNGLVKIETKR